MSLLSHKPTSDLLIVGLGNPGDEYEYTRHNIGYLAVDALAHEASGVGGAFVGMNTPGKNLSSWRSQCDSLCATIKIAEQTVVLTKPLTFMNCSGGAVKGLLKHYHLTVNQLIVVHDDLDIPEHELRLKDGGGHGGHNGLRDINASVGDTYKRLRVGIGRPPGRMPADRFVLQRTTGEVKEALLIDATRAADVLEHIIRVGFTAVQNTLNAG